MRTAIGRTAFLVWLLAPAAAVSAAVSPEALSAGSWEAITALQTPGLAATPRFVKAPREEAAPALEELGKTAGEPLSLVATEQKAKAAAAPVKEADLNALYNRQLKTSLQYSLGGKTVWASGVFDRSKDAYLSILEDGKTPVFYNIKDLLGSSPNLRIGSASYEISLAANAGTPLKSKILITNKADDTDEKSFSLKQMIAAISAVGEQVVIGGQNYSFFYYDDMKAGKADSSSQSFAFLLTDTNGDFDIFMIPAELVPSGSVAVFKMSQNKRMGLQKSGGTLKVYDNP
jgi:hypothetical protein